MDTNGYSNGNQDKLAELFRQFEKADSSEDKKQIVDMICSDPMLHSSTPPEGQHAKRDHEEIKGLLKAVRDTRHMDAHWEKQVERLKHMLDIR